MAQLRMKPYFQDETLTQYCGDCRVVLPCLESDSVDSIATDPPYELGFMGKSWDRSGIAYNLEVWRECLRVLKPGGHLLAFGGSRTYHRLACAIEDAGFEIRDQVQYIYGSGFPKSLNVSKNLRDEGSVCICNERNGDLLCLQDRISDVEGMAETRHEADLFAPMQRGVARAGVGHARPQRIEGQNTGELPERSDARPEESGMEGRSNLFSEARELRSDKVGPMPAGVSADGSQGRVCDGAPFDHGAMDRPPVDENGSSASRRSQSSEQPANESAVMAGQSQPQTSGAWPLCGRCGKPVVPEGIGSALKPAHEPIVVARKPFSSTLIQNVLRYGTGGLNIDGCRIETSGDDYGRSNAASDGSVNKGKFFSGLDSGNGLNAYANDLGRWPANVIHDGSDEVVSLFPETATGSLTPYTQQTRQGNAYGLQPAIREVNHVGDTGSAARFFYCAKADKVDRNEGLDDLELRSAGAVTDRKDGSDGLNSPRAGAGRTNGSRNHHPTVKPTDLMRYLVRLVTPPNGVVLDPFGGSGSTGKACALEGLKAILIEKEQEYCEIAIRRARQNQRLLNFA